SLLGTPRGRTATPSPNRSRTPDADACGVGPSWPRWWRDAEPASWGGEPRTLRLVDEWSVVETGFGRRVSGDPGVPHPSGLCGIVGGRPGHQAPVVPPPQI